MKTILAISSSASENSSNTQLLQVLSTTFADTFSISIYDSLSQLALYTPQIEQAGVPANVLQLRQQIAEADAVIICTPEYVHNIPAVLKNILEWITTSGELSEKPVLPITFAPAAPRGQYAMISLLQSLRACNAKIVTELSLYRNEFVHKNGEISIPQEQLTLLKEAISLL